MKEVIGAINEVNKFSCSQRVHYISWNSLKRSCRSKQLKRKWYARSGENDDTQMTMSFSNLLNALSKTLSKDEMGIITKWYLIKHFIQKGVIENSIKVINN